MKELAKPQNSPECRFLPVLVPGFTPKQMSRLATFHNMVKRARETMIENRSAQPGYFGYVVEGKMTDVYFRMDSRFAATVNETAESMYRDELSQDPILKEAADNIVDRVRDELEGPTMSVEEVKTLFERP